MNQTKQKRPPAHEHTAAPVCIVCAGCD